MYTTERSKADFTKFQEFEKLKHDSFFLPTYQRLGIKVLQDVVGNGRWSPYDVYAEQDGKKFTIDEKARTQNYGDLLVEVMQCVRTGKTGWLYHRCDKIFYAAWSDMTNEDDPQIAYLIDVPKLRELVASNFARLSTVMSEKGYGITMNKRVNWEDILHLGIGEKIV